MGPVRQFLNPIEMPPRLKNIQERLAMFQKLGFGDLKDKMKGGTDGEKRGPNQKRVVEAREKSRRIQEKGAKGGKNTILSDIGATMGEEWKMDSHNKFPFPYRVFHRLADRGWVDFDLRCSTILPGCCADSAEITSA